VRSAWPASIGRARSLRLSRASLLVSSAWRSKSLASAKCCPCPLDCQIHTSLALEFLCSRLLRC
jgi:hypothetical protein